MGATSASEHAGPSSYRSRDSNVNQSCLSRRLLSDIRTPLQPNSRGVKDILRKARNLEPSFEEEEEAEDSATAAGPSPRKNVTTEPVDPYQIIDDADADVDVFRKRKLKHLRSSSKEQQELHFLKLSSNAKQKHSEQRQSTAPPVKQKQSKKPTKRVAVDVYIPSIVSVGNLAKLLKVKLGVYFVLYYHSELY